LLFTCKPFSLPHFPGKKKKPDECAVERDDELSVLLNHCHISYQAEELSSRPRRSLFPRG